jgi:putative tricarboxylic transport membrane protein
MTRAELVADVVWVVLGLGICLHALRLQLWSATTGPGSGFLPFIAGALVALIGVALLVRAWARRRRDGPATPFWEDAAGRNRVGLVVITLCVMAYLMPILGFLLAAILVMTFLLGLTRQTRLAAAIVLSLLSTLSIYWLFASLLQVRLPLGPLGF